jgi:hypothetical protein
MDGTVFLLSGLDCRPSTNSRLQLTYSYESGSLQREKLKKISAAFTDRLWLILLGTKMPPSTTREDLTVRLSTLSRL